MTECPCGSSKPYGACCKPYITGQAIAPTAEILMRSRYSAYVKGQVDYLISSHHPSKRKANDRFSLSKNIQSTTWLGLTILNTQQGQPIHRTGVVEFVALYQSGGVGQLHERSHFVKQKDHWFYLDGEISPPLSPKRSDPCWCGSGKKFKHCHGK